MTGTGKGGTRDRVRYLLGSFRATVAGRAAHTTS
ncbi:MAG: hypothetical protein JWP90_329 [Mycetocola sp.]|jgi:hypothetical protein|nr:hypothetical protein [Mycetocola sp.]